MEVVLPVWAVVWLLVLSLCACVGALYIYCATRPDSRSKQRRDAALTALAAALTEEASSLAIKQMIELGITGYAHTEKELRNNVYWLELDCARHSRLLCTFDNLYDKHMAALTAKAVANLTAARKGHK